jgi:oligopeptide transport system permease protein
MGTPVVASAGAELMQSAVKPRSLWDDALRRLMRNKAAVAGMILLGLITLIAIFGPYFMHWSYDMLDRDNVMIGPDMATRHYFGTDSQGRDQLVRLMYGVRVSMAVGLVATFVSLVIGVIYGAFAGFIGGRIDDIMMRAVDILYSLPFIFFVIILMVVFGRNFILMFVAIGAVEWLTMARIVRGQTISIKQKEFVEAARAAGVGPIGIVFRHLVPNVLGPVVVYVTLTIPAVILAESFLSFIGLGVQEPLTSLGVLISKGAADMEMAPWLLIFPAVTMVLTLFCFNFIGDGLRDAIDPKDR